MTRQATDELYIDLEYFTPEEYYVYVAEAKVDAGFYIEPDYIEQGYYEELGAFATLSCELTEVLGVTVEAEGAFNTSTALAVTVAVTRTSTVDAVAEFDQTTTVGKLFDVTLEFDALFTPNFTVEGILNSFAILDTTASLAATTSKFTGYESLQEFFAALNAQADRFAQADAELTAVADTAAQAARLRDTQISLAVSFDTTTSADKVVAVDAALTTDFALAADVQIARFVDFASDLTSESTLSASYITYKLRPSDSTLVVYGPPKHEQIEIDSTLSKFGQGSAKRTYDREMLSISGPYMRDANRWVAFGATARGFNDAVSFKNQTTLFESTDLESWSEIPGATNFGFAGSDAFFDGTNYVFTRGVSSSLYQVTPDGVNFTSVVPQFVDANNRSYTPIGNRIVYLNGFYYQLFKYFQSLTGLYVVARNSTMSATGWTSVLQNTLSSNTEFFLSAQPSVNGQSAVFYGYARNYSNNNLSFTTIVTTNGGTTWTPTVIATQTTFGIYSATSVAISGSNVFRVSNSTGSGPVYQNASIVFNPSGGVESIHIIDNKFFYKNNSQLKVSVGSWSQGTTLPFEYPDAANNVQFLDNKYITSGNRGDFKQHIPTFEYSTDALNWTGVETPSQSIATKGGLSYTKENIDQWNSIDTWVYVNPLNDDPLFSDPTQPVNSWNLGGVIVFGNYELNLPNINPGTTNTRVFLYEKTQGLVAASTTYANTHNQWNHIRILRSGSNLKVYFNGVQALQITNYSNDSYDEVLLNGVRRIAPTVADAVEIWIDDFHATKKLLNNYSDTSITVPTTPAQVDDDTVLYLPFDSTLEEPSRPVTFDVEVDLLTNSTLAATIGGSFTTQSTLTLSSALTADIDRISLFGANLEADTALAVEGSRVVGVDAQLSVNTDITATAQVLVDVESSQNTTSDITVDYTRIRDAEIQTESIATKLVAAAKIGQGFITLESFFDQTAQATLTVDYTADLNSEFAQTTDSENVRGIDSTLNSEFTQTTDVDKLSGVAVIANAVFSQTAQLEKTTDYTSDLNSEFTQTADVDKFSGNQIVMNGAFVQSTVGDRTRGAAVDLETNTELLISADIGIIGSADLTSTATLAIEPLIIRSSTVEFESIATKLVAVARIGQGFITLESFFNQTTDARVTTGNVVDMPSSFTVQAQGQRSRFADSNLVSEFDISVIGVTDKDVVADLTATAGMTTSAHVIADFLVTADSSADLTADAAKIMQLSAELEALNSKLVVVEKSGGLTADLTVDSALVADVNRTANTGAEFDSTAQLLALGERIRFGAADPVSEFDIAAQGDRTRTLSAEINSALDFVATVRAERLGEINIDVVSTLAATPSVTRTVTAELNSEFDIAVLGGKTAQAEAQLSSEFTQSADGRLFSIIQRLVYTIPKETRVYTIPKETRGYTVPRENRTHIIRR